MLAAKLGFAAEKVVLLEAPHIAYLPGEPG